LAGFEENKMLMKTRIAKHSKRFFAEFHIAVRAVAVYEQRRIVAGVRINERPVRCVKIAVDRRDELMILDRFPQKIVDL
jgi:hypothetical protein